MGCDIHAHVEVKIGGVWHHWSSLDLPRNYRMFALMADVRNYEHKIDPIAFPKGIPSDATEITKITCNEYGSGGHSHSWLSVDELNQLFNQRKDEWWTKGDYDWRPEDRFGYVFGNGITDMEAHKACDVDDVRLVFWFDN